MQLENTTALFGYLSSEMGVGESCRGLVSALDAGGINSELYDNTANPSRQNDKTYANRFLNSAPKAKNAIIHVNADQVDAFFASHLGALAAPIPKKIGYWYWELEDFPAYMMPPQVYFDEIWVASEFTQKALSRKLMVPVHVVPPAYSAFLKYSKEECRNIFDLSQNKKLILSMFDGFSFMDRKNPMGAIEAVERMLKLHPEHKDKIELVIKSININPSDEERLKARLGSIPYRLIKNYLNRDEVYKLISSSDLFVSLHRAEGLGLPCMEAMMLGVPVLATGYSGNTTFMKPENSYFVNYKRVRLGYARGPYSATNFWAEPDYEDASIKMATALFDDNHRAKIIQQAQSDIEYHFSPVRVGELIRQRLFGEPIQKNRLDQVSTSL